MSTSTKAETRDRILDEARRLLVERGYHGVGLDEIAHAAGVSRQAIYMHHFKSKSDLLLAMVEHVDRTAGIAEHVAPVFAARTALAALDAMVVAMVAIDSRVRDIAWVIEGARVTDAAAEAAWQDRMKGRARFVRSVVDRLETEGRLAPGWTAADAADFTWAVMSHATHRALVGERGWTPERYVRRMQRALRAALVRGRRAGGARRADLHTPARQR
jgi:AcrR family transcriptional regulator